MSLLSLKKMRSSRPNFQVKPETTASIPTLQLAMEAGIREAQNRKLARQAQMPPGFKPSALGGPCLRCSLYSYLRVPSDREMDVASQLMMTMGRATHSAMKEILRETVDIIELKPGTDKEFKVEERSWPMLGFLDSLLVHENELWLLEIKSVNKYAMNNIDAPKPQHRIQTAIYRELFNRLLKEGIFNKYEHLARLANFPELAGTVFYYVNRDFGDAKEFWERPDLSLFPQVEEEVRVVKHFVSLQELPDRAQECGRYSDYARKCKAGFDPFKRRVQ